VRVVVGHAERAALAPQSGPQLIAQLKTRQWQGNVRELRNVVERAVVMADSSASPLVDDETPAPRPPPPGTPAPLPGEDWLARALPPGYLEQPYKEARDDLVGRFERRYLTRLMEKHGKNLSAIAREAQVGLQVIRRMIDRQDQRR